MIDTKKYEGHTPSPWLWYDDGGISSSIRLYHITHIDEDLAEIHYGENCIADARLMADAPSLLAEVIRLRSHIAHHVGDEYRQCPECGSLDFTFKFDDEGIECKCDKMPVGTCDNIWRVKIE